MILMIDNYDSFTYNLVQYLYELGTDVKVYRNDKISVSKIKKMKPEGLVISPGPCTPREAGISNEAIQAFSGKIPILGVCLGHQCIGHVFGGRVIRAKKIMHGKTSKIYHDHSHLFKKIENPFTATRYHSLLVERKTLPSLLKITAWTKEQEIMGLKHSHHPTFGVQFHPESILTNCGKKILSNFLELL
ncbi:MAG: anthranilate/aminodeoxychorismate synthase component II [Omnitrophica bacterium RIFCSPLOWO2_12_FULL_44_17]|uniref:Anthranilate/aminodeoxychorismate synthase component II n=1 Tax=Candidatus Danuiimicrobium aquiferis TaxID=1801832 RepID=A0A1G1KYR6_9BACT|nr:MAG: anthranilate/aminodeoxychorismate synthase component II [Omnitrophica bacterium RIFCSPHIGHO2_02_FULL_45_28]OGW91632.1 MAG: anthranilate/aminodeoxychorismate synthase component II [Omnitrophica bacterium RIFCSPHIGHO2_12_FULL_44_12]OGW97992.1 MAG: anthranilate/aminodeoxychorismate synthase component II [Omnitrophica bacterium RIFCSPLOWO2_12_FULL_44_17]OGX03564.1 MAG: anthranilate/aminodeoxychorismate synthase component II [Omnitrophica bacterium RIFCSPLOWO2_02_FULL_44_11]